MSKGDQIKRAFEIILMFQSGPVTARKVMDKFEISRNAAVQWIDQASIYLPIIENGFDESTGGRPSRIYEMMK